MRKSLAIHGSDFSEEFCQVLDDIIATLEGRNWSYSLPEALRDYDPNWNPELWYQSGDQLQGNVDLLLSLGGDGTFLSGVVLQGNNDIPMLGLNIGRLGFLASAQLDQFDFTLDCLEKGRYRIIERSLVEATSGSGDLDFDFPYALNELTFMKNETSSMLTIKVWLDDEFLNAYWADGLIISTPTGSTAYSLSCGGPILMPQSKNFILTPIAPHNLNVRPVVVPDAAEIRVEVDGRAENFLMAMDSRHKSFDKSCRFRVCRAPFTVKVVEPEGQRFLNTLRNKMHWGLDRRN